ncbi:MAG: hypothetical protein FWC54_01105 [Actinomycetia bacterium]|nr:hypothetical protein [Actinomycetes bacterium]
MNHVSVSTHRPDARRARLALILALLLALCLPGQAFAAFAPGAAQVDALISQVATWESAQLAGQTQGPTYGNEWALMALSRAGKLSDALKQQYLANLARHLKNNGGSLGNTVTDYDRVILALTSMGVDATDFAGVNLTAPLASFDDINSQGVSGVIYALLALDSHNYPTPSLLAGSAETPTTREALVSALLDAQLAAGGWNWGWGDAADPDLTSMAICALVPYYHTGNAQIDAAIDDALTVLGTIQDDATAGFTSDWSPTPASESSAQALVALSSLGVAIDDARFVKAGGNLYDSLTGFLIDAKPDVKAFVDYAGDAAPSGMATEQGLYALVAFSRSLTAANRLYDMTDITLQPFVSPPNGGGTGGGATGGGNGTGGSTGGNGGNNTGSDRPADGAGSPSIVATKPATTLPAAGDTTERAALVSSLLLSAGTIVVLMAWSASRRHAKRRSADD